MFPYLSYLCNSSLRIRGSLCNVQPRSDAVTDLMPMFLEALKLVVPQLHPLQSEYSIFFQDIPNRGEP